MGIITVNFKKYHIVLIVIALSVVIGGLTAIIPITLLPYFIGACLLSGVAFLALMRPVLLLYVIILTSAMAGLFRSFETLTFGATSITVSGFKWIFFVGLIVIMLVANIHRVQFPKHFLPFLLFTLWTILLWLSTSLNISGLKDVLFYSLPVLIGVYTLLSLSANNKTLVKTIEKLMLYSVLVPLLLYAVLIVFGLINITEVGPKGVVDPRAVATYLLVVFSLSLAQWRYAAKNTQRHLAAFVSLVALSIIIFTLSRTAIATALILFAIFRINPFKSWKILPCSLLIGVLFAALLFGLPALRTRIFYAPPSNLSEAQEYLITSGRNKMWPTTFNHALEKPIVGWAPGSARVLVGSLFPKRKEAHPHNEYLQVFHDTGIIGLTLLLVAWLFLLVRYWKRWRFAHLSGDLQGAKWNMASFLCILTVLINAIVDNTLHYPFIIAPVFIIIGCADFLNRHLYSSRRARLENGGVDLPSHG